MKKPTYIHYLITFDTAMIKIWNFALYDWQKIRYTRNSTFFLYCFFFSCNSLVYGRKNREYLQQEVALEKENYEL